MHPYLLPLLLLLPYTLSSPLPGPTPTPTLQERDIASLFSTLTASLAAEVTSYLGTLPSDALAGVLPAFNGLPSPSGIKSKLNISDAQLQAEPLRLMNIPGYANWTDQGWSLRVHGFAYKQPPLSDSQVDDAAKIFLPGLNTSNLTTSERVNSRNLTASLLAIPWPGVLLNFTLVDPNDELNQGGATGQGRGPGGGNGEGVTSYVGLNRVTSDVGEFDEFVRMGSVLGIADGNSSSATSVYRKDLISPADPLLGNSSAYFVPPTGLTIISDIDDILRVTQIYQPELGLQNSFAKNFTPWSTMPQIYQNWSTIPGVHFHYLTTTPEQATRPYLSFIDSVYPLGSFDDRPLNFTTLDQIIAIRKVRLFQVLESFKGRKVVLVADTSNSDVMKDYPLARQTFGDQIACILLRNTSATDSSDHFPYDTSGFAGIDNSTYMFFRTPDDLVGIDLLNGCRNTTFPQNITFKYQGLPTSLSSLKSGAEGRGRGRGRVGSVAVAAVVGVVAGAGWTVW